MSKAYFRELTAKDMEKTPVPVILMAMISFTFTLDLSRKSMSSNNNKAPAAHCCLQLLTEIIKGHCKTQINRA